MNKQNNKPLTNSECTPYCVEVIQGEECHSFAQPSLPEEENCTNHGPEKPAIQKQCTSGCDGSLANTKSHNSEGDPCYLEVIKDPQPPMSIENSAISEQKPSTSSNGASILSERNYKSEGIPYYLELIQDKDLLPFTQSPVPKENSGGKPLLHEMKDNVCEGTSSMKEENSLYDAVVEDRHPYPLPALPSIPASTEHKDEVEQDENSTYDDICNYADPEWPANDMNKGEFRLKVNLNPLGLRK